MSYDINLKKTQLGYQFDRNVYIGYQTNDNRVVTVKELKNLNITGGGGGGGGGGIQSITISGNPSAGTITLTVDNVSTEVAATNVTADSTTPPSDAKICVIAGSGNSYKVYETTHTWSEVPTITIGGDTLVSVTTGATTTVLTLGAGLTQSTTGTTTTLSIASNVVRGMSIDGSGLHYQDGSGTHDLGGTIGTTSVGVLSIATSTSQSPSSDSLVSVGYLEEQYQGGNVYSTATTPDGTQTSDKNTRFIFVEVE